MMTKEERKKFDDECEKLRFDLKHFFDEPKK